MFSALFESARAVLAIGNKFSGVISDVLERLADGKLSVDEAGQLGRTLALESGDWQVRVRKGDVLDEETQALIGEAAGRVAARIYGRMMSAAAS